MIKNYLNIYSTDFVTGIFLILFLYSYVTILLVPVSISGISIVCGSLNLILEAS